MLFFIFAILPLAYIHGINIQPRIIDGYISNPENFPFFTFVLTNEGNCGATLISDRWIQLRLIYLRSWKFVVFEFKCFSLLSWVLTAAHCLSNGTADVFFGIKADGRFTSTIEIPASNQYTHPEFIFGMFPPHDIGSCNIHKCSLSHSNAK